MVTNQRWNRDFCSLPLRVLRNHAFRETECNLSAVKLHSNLVKVLKNIV